MEQKKRKCYIYVRVSTSMQVDGYSLDAQRDRLKKFAEFQDMEVIREYSDEGKSGKSVTGRPEFINMLKDIENNRDDVDYILVFKLSRFGRNAADVLNSLQLIQDYGVNLICVEDGIDSSKDSGKLTITVLSAVAEIERENILVQTMEGRKQKAREGKWNGGPAPFGYRLAPQNESLVIEPEEAEIVKIIFNQFAYSKMGLVSIANYLNERGYAKQKNRDFELNYFTAGHVKHILDNPVYAGFVAYGKNVTEKVKGTRDKYRRVKSDDYLLTEGKHEAIIDMALWKQTCMKRKETGIRNLKTHSLEHEHILTGLLKCPICGTGMSGTVNRRKNKETGEYKDDFYYRCKHRRKINENEFCNFSINPKQDTLNAEVEKIIMDLVNQQGCMEFITKKLEENVDVSNLEAEREKLAAQLKQIKGAKNKLEEMLDRLDVTDKHYNRKYEDMHHRLDTMFDKIVSIEDAITDIDVKTGNAFGKQDTLKRVYEILKYFDTMYYVMTDMEKKQFFRGFIESIELFPEKHDNGDIVKQIYFRFPIFYKGQVGDTILLPDGKTVETVAKLLRKF